FLTTLFKKLNTPEGKGSFEPHFNKFPYVNGGLFRDDIQCPKFSTKARQILLDSGELDWSEINPDIFGSMIQAVADPAERNNLGMHYTSVVNILKLIKPLFLDDLYEEFEKNKGKIKGLEALLDRLGKIKFFDPACGSGNFLIITYKELRNLEIQIIKELLDLNATQRKIYFSEIKLSQFYGIEIKDFAHEMAILSLWLAEHQMNQVFELELLDYGKSNPILPLKESGNITAGNAARVDWEQVCPKEANDEIYIIGNPPYLGARYQDEEQKYDIALNFPKLKGANNLDYIFIWFNKGVNYIKNYNAKLGLVSTNSVCQGEQVSLLWPTLLANSIEIDFAYQSFKWINNAKGNAGVVVVIIGLRNISNKPKYIFTESIAKQVKNINAYLLEGNNIFIDSRTKPLAQIPEMNFGSMANDNGNLILNEDEKQYLIAKNPKVKQFIKGLIGSKEFIRGENRYCLWISDSQKHLAYSIPEVKNRIDECEKSRKESKRKATNKLAEFPYRFGEVRHIDSDSIIIPSVSSEKREYIPMGFLNKDTVISNLAFGIYNAHPWIFGVLNSKMHMVWVKSIGGYLGTSIRYSAKICYNTFPFPTLSEKKKETINQYVFAILDERAKYPEKTMAWLYNPETMPSGLKQAHKELDLAIEQIYRLAPFHSDEERLEYLFKLYDEMTTKETLFTKEKKGKKK
ncbi:MAG: class I SAM-dependent DNA methyltransferase, partial [Empedobacter falsenii]